MNTRGVSIRCFEVVIDSLFPQIKLRCHHQTTNYTMKLLFWRIVYDYEADKKRKILRKIFGRTKSLQQQQHHLHHHQRYQQQYRQTPHSLRHVDTRNSPKLSRVVLVPVNKKIIYFSYYEKVNKNYYRIYYEYMNA